MKIRILYLVHVITLGVIFALRNFYNPSITNLFENIYNLFNYKIPVIKSVLYFFLIMSIFASAFLIKKNILNQVLIGLLIIINCLIITLSIKVW